MSTTKNRQTFDAPDARLTVLVDSDPGALAVNKALSDKDGPSHIRVLNECDSAAIKGDNLIVFAASSRLEHVAECVSVANKAHHLAALVVHNDVAPNWLPYVLHRSGLRALRNMIVHTDAELPTRILSAWAIGAEHDFIADAAVLDDRLVVKSCSFDEYSVSFDAFPALQMIPDSARSRFVLEEDGLLLYWPDSQVHLSLDDIRFADDPKRQQEARLAQVGEQRAVGAALKRLREEAGLKQSDISGLSERHVRRVESGDRLTTDTLEAFAEAMRVDPDYLFERVSELVDESVSVDREAYSGLGTPSGVKNEQLNLNPLDPSLARSLGLTSGRTGAVAEPLRLAAESTEDSTSRLWSLTLAHDGSVQGRLEHDPKTDELLFVIEEVRNTGAKGLKVTILASSARLEEPLVSQPFLPVPGGRISITSGRGIVPSDVSNLVLRVANE